MNGISRRHISKRHESLKKLKVSNSQKEYQTHEKPKRRNWLAKRGTLSHFLTSIIAKHQKIERGPFGEKLKKCLNAEKIERDPLVSPGILC